MNDILILVNTPVEKRDKLLPHSKRTSNAAQRLLLFSAA